MPFQGLREGRKRSRCLTHFNGRSRCVCSFFWSFFLNIHSRRACRNYCLLGEKARQNITLLQNQVCFESYHLLREVLTSSDRYPFLVHPVLALLPRRTNANEKYIPRTAPRRVFIYIQRSCSRSLYIHSSCL